MNCRKVNNLLSAYMDNELAGVEQLQIRDHLRTCSCCNEEYESLLTTKRMLSRLSVQQPKQDLEQRILERIVAEGDRSPVGFRLSSWWGLMPEPQRASLRAAALFGVFAFAAGLYVYSPLSKEPSQTAREVAAQPQPLQTVPAGSLQDMLAIQNSSEAGRPMSGGATIAPAGLYGPVRGGTR